MEERDCKKPPTEIRWCMLFQLLHDKKILSSKALTHIQAVNKKSRRPRCWAIMPSPLSNPSSSSSSSILQNLFLDRSKMQFSLFFSCPWYEMKSWTEKSWKRQMNESHPLLQMWQISILFILGDWEFWRKPLSTPYLFERVIMRWLLLLSPLPVITRRQGRNGAIKIGVFRSLGILFGDLCKLPCPLPTPTQKKPFMIDGTRFRVSRNESHKQLSFLKMRRSYTQEYQDLLWPFTQTLGTSLRLPSFSHKLKLSWWVDHIHHIVAKPRIAKPFRKWKVAFPAASSAVSLADAT